MFKTRHLLFRTKAEPAEAQGLLEAKTAPGAPSADDMVGMLKDTVTTDARPFRGRVEGPRFTLTRRVRGRRVRAQLEGELRPLETGGTEVRASIAAPWSLRAGFLGGSLATLTVATVAGVQGGQPWLGLAIAPALALAGWLGDRLFSREQSETFRALRDALPAEPAPVPTAVSELEPGQVAEPQRARERG